MNSLLNDLRFAMRTLVRSPGFAFAAIATLGLGIGATTMVFSLVNGVVLRPWPYEQPSQLIGLTEADRSGQYEATSYPNFVDYRSGMRSVSGLAAYTAEPLTVKGDGAAERLTGARVSYNLMDVLGTRPIMGRTFRSDEDVPNAERVVVIGYGLWQRSFAADRNVIGKTAIVEGEPHVIIGVMPAGFDFPQEGQAWLPLREDPTANRGLAYLNAIGRLAPSATVEQARAEAETIRTRLTTDHPANGRDRIVRVGQLQEMTVREVRSVLFILLAAVAFVLLIACANVANLLLSRAASRDREIAIRTALGAGRMRLIRQLLTESALLGLAGGGLGVMLASWWLDLMIGSIPDLPGWLRISIDRTVLLFTLGVALVTAIIFGLAPALQSVKTDVQATLKEGRGTTGSIRKNRLRSALVVVQLALAVVLLVGGLLMSRSFLAMRHVDPGFRIENIIALDLSLPGGRYEPTAAREVFYNRLLERVRGLPGVQQAGAISSLPIAGANMTSNFSVEGRTASDPEAARQAFRTVVTPDYFKTMDIPLLRGRYFQSSDLSSGEKVAIINQRLAELFFGTDDPVGKRIAWGAGNDLEWMTIVGVTANVNQADINQTRVNPEIHQPFTQDARRGMSVVVRFAGEPQTMLPALRREVQSLDSNIPVYNFTTMREVVRQAVWDAKLNSSLFAAFALAALLLAAVGLYGVIAYSVVQRTQEIGVRMALGAEPTMVTRMIVGQGLRLTSIGIAIGMVGAYAMAKAMAGILYGVKSLDPVTFITVPVLLGIVAILASWIPARRVLRVDPLTAMRLE